MANNAEKFNRIFIIDNYVEKDLTEATKQSTEQCSAEENQNHVTEVAARETHHNGHENRIFSTTDLTVCSAVSKESQEEVKLYKTRFWVLGLFSFLIFVECMVFGTFSTIMESAEYAYNWDDGYIALLDAWGPINSVLFMVPFSWFAMKYGLRKGVLLAAGLITVGTALRCMSTDDTAFTYLASFGCIANGMASTLTQSLPPVISTTWFPVAERTTATAVGVMIAQLAVAAMYLSPLIVPRPGDFSRDEIKSDIRTLMLIQFGMATVAFTCIIVYFPAKPKTPPTLSSSVERVRYFKSLKMLLRNRDVILVALVYVYGFGYPFLWFSVINFSLECIGIYQNETMYIAVVASIVAAIASLIAARVTDFLKGMKKNSIICLLIAATVFYIWFLLLTEKVITSAVKAQVYITVTGALASVYAAAAIVVEMCVELAYPCPENAVGALFIFLFDLNGIIFLFLLMIQTDCYRWLSYVIPAGVILSVVLLLPVKEIKKRSDVDAVLDKST